MNTGIDHFFPQFSVDIAAKIRTGILFQNSMPQGIGIRRKRFIECQDMGFQLHGKSASGIHISQEVFICPGGGHLIQEKLHGFHGTHFIKEFSQDPHPGQFGFGHQEFFLTGS